MADDTSAPEALCFDMYGTLCDTQAVTTALGDHLDAPASVIADVAELWRQRQQKYFFRAEAMDAYRPLSELTAGALDYALAFHGRELSDESVEAVLEAYERLDPYDDALAAFDALGDAGVDLAVFSNGSPDMLEPLAENVGIADRVEAIVSADEVGTYKPAPAAYEHAADSLGHDVGECWLISSNTWDLVGARSAGMGAGRVARSNEPYDAVFEADPTVTVDSLGELAEAVRERRV